VYNQATSVLVLCVDEGFGKVASIKYYVEITPVEVSHLGGGKEVLLLKSNNNNDTSLCGVMAWIPAVTRQKDQ